jgi:hypothetical protein
MRQGSGLDQYEGCAHAIDLDLEGLVEMAREVVQPKKLHDFPLAVEHAQGGPGFQYVSDARHGFSAVPRDAASLQRSTRDESRLRLRPGRASWRSANKKPRIGGAS